MTSEIQKSWWILLLRGFFAIIFGLLALFLPGLVLETLLLFFGILAIVSGVFLFFDGIIVKGDRIIKIIEGLLWVVIGVLVLLLPITSLTVIMFFIAFWAIVIGIFQIIMSIRLRKVIENEWLGILNGLFSFVFGILIMFNLLAGAEAIIMVFGIFAILFGITSIVLSFRVKSIKAE
ncbi:MAG: DUF308 domain-containing protein [Ignavibacteria bacterium]|nr:DUF308 domain-containing protein [Ignavibacteria bacterium]